MRILLIGNNGQVGWELQRTLAPLGDVFSIDFPAIDLTDYDGLRSLIRKVKPQVIVNAAAYTAVDPAESEPDIAMAVNGIAPGILAEEANQLGAALVHYSTDYVFDGRKEEEYLEIDEPNPINQYGKSKLAGENAIMAIGGSYVILRTSWVYSLRIGGFVNKVLKWARQNRSLRIVADQVSSPTWCRMLAEVTAQILSMGGNYVVPWLDERRGLYHLAGSGAASRFEWAQAILKYDHNAYEQVVKEIYPALTKEFPSLAQRPHFSSLNCDRFEETFGLRLPNWDDALMMAMDTQ